MKNTTDTEIFQFIREKVLVENEVVYKEELLKLYNQSKSQSLSDARPLLEKVKEHFGDEITIVKPKYGKQFLYNESLTKADIISRFIGKLEETGEKLKPDTQGPSKEATVISAAKYIRDEIKNMPKTYDNWPPTTAQLFQCKTILSDLTELFLKNVICSRADRISNRRQHILQSIGQDIVYNTLDGKTQTSKHTAFAVHKAAYWIEKDDRMA